jgi:hypothetical protein
MMTQSMAWVPAVGSVEQDPLRRYRAELSIDVLDSQGELLDWVIRYAFDTLDASQLTLRVTAPIEPSQLSPVVL